NAAAVVGGHVAVDADGTGAAVDLNAADIEDEAVAERGVDFVLWCWGAQLGRGPEGGLEDGMVEIGGLHPRRPVTGGGEARQWHGVVRVPAGAHVASNKLDMIGCDIELWRGQARKLCLEPDRGNMGGTAHCRRKPARVVARRDRPGV